MARNRFENYISNQYTPQFTPTPIDANMAFNVINARQGYYDNIMKAIDQLNPDLEYIRPNEFNQGDLPIANQLYQSRAQEQQSLIDDILKTDNLNDAARRVAKLANDPTYKQTAEALKMRKLQKDQERKMLEDNYGKDVYFNDYLRHFEQNYLTPFDVTNYGLKSAIGAITPPIAEILKDFTGMMEANQFQTADGRMIGKTEDGQYFITKEGTTKYISFEEAKQELEAGVYGDPRVQPWLNVMDKLGKGKEVRDMLNAQIMGAASAKAYTQNTSNIDYMNNRQWDLNASGNKDNPYGEPSFNPWNMFESQAPNIVNVDEQGNLVVNWEVMYSTPEYKQLQEEFEKETRTYNANETSAQREQRIKNAGDKVNNFIKEKYNDQIIELDKKYPGMSPQAKANFINESISGQMYMHQLTDATTGNPIEAKKTRLETFRSNNLYEMTPTGPKRVTYEDVLSESNSQETADKGNVFVNGVNVVSTMPPPDKNRSDKEQYTIYSGTPFSIGDKKYIASENNTTQQKRYSQFNSLFNIKHDISKNYGTGIIESETYGPISMISFRVPEIDQNGQKTGRMQVKAAEGKYDENTGMLIVKTINPYTQEVYDYHLDPKDENALRSYAEDPNNTFSDEEVYNLIPRQTRKK